MNAASATGARDEPQAATPGTGDGPGARRGAARPAPARNPHLEHLPLDMLRRYRKELTAEEGRVSYWRRIVQARLDIVRATAGDGPLVDHLLDVLGGVPVQSSRTALLQVVGADDIPPLPDLTELWRREIDPRDSGAATELALGLEEAERRLSQYRAALIHRLDTATAELIARYREDPSACLVALPLRPEPPPGRPTPPV